MKTKMRIHLPAQGCGQDIWNFPLEKIPPLATRAAERGAAQTKLVPQTVLL